MKLKPYLNDIDRDYFDHFCKQETKYARLAVMHRLRSLVYRVITELEVDTPPKPGTELFAKLEEALLEASAMHRRDPDDDDLWRDIQFARGYMRTGWADPTPDHAKRS